MVHGVSWLGIALLVVTVTTVQASPDAERMFRDGRALAGRGQWAAACDRFERSRQLEVKVGTLLNLADCRVRLGQTATGWALFLEAKSLAAQEGDRRREREALRRAQALEPRLAYLIAVVDGPAAPGLSVGRDGTAIAAALWNESVPIDPGRYTIAATAPGREPWTAEVVVAAGQRVRIEVPALALAPARPPLAAPAPAPAPAVSVELSAVPAGGDRPWPTRRFGIGGTLGTNTTENTLLGFRIVAAMAVGDDQLRGIASVTTLRYEDDPGFSTRAWKLGASCDYLWLPVPQVAIGGGVGLGADLDVPDQGRPFDVGGWWSLRASPVIARLARGRAEIGLHVQVIRAGDEWQTLFTLAGDVYLW